jgi:aerobic-type carbon monoxide dehydrogenase small subunit (CoxS/CutS family)
MYRNLSRRAFLQRSAATTATVTLTGAAPLVAAQAAGRLGTEGVGPGPAAISLWVNGVAHGLRVEPSTTLAEALRGSLALTGTKVACDRGACSACTVWLDGAPVCSCMILAVDVGGRHVTTIEGLADGDHLHPVQAAFIEHDATQCGFCTPGLVMSCAALVRDRPDLGEDDVCRAISGHLCRCGTYPHVVAATLAVAAREKA